MKLVIVESPTKAKTISKFLGKDYKVLSSFGHLRDLPKKEMGVDIEHNFKPKYVIPTTSEKHVKAIKTAAKKADEIYFATDKDREGEAISWHLAKILEIDPKKAKRISFHEITKPAIEEALQEPQPLDLNIVDAQQARRILDRLVGFELSPFLWKKVARGLSAGRVQSVAVRMVVEREREVKAFKPDEYWTVETEYEKGDIKFPGKLHSQDGKKLEKLEIGNKKQADKILANLKDTEHKISAIKKKEVKRKPSPPFTTSTLQQDANHKLHYSAKNTMRIAQQLYEGVELGSEGAHGLITYMRTDSLNLSEKFLDESTNLINEKFGKEFTLEKPRVFKTKSKGAQEAHEAVRPTEVNRIPEEIKEYLTTDQFKLYDLIWRRALGSQMKEAVIDQTSVDIAADKYTFRSSGSILKFEGFYKIYPEARKEKILPELAKDDVLKLLSINPNQHFTEPPPRFNDASLVKALEEHGIGRPSTYAPTIGTIIDRGYVTREEKTLRPTDIAGVVTDLLTKHFEKIADYEFTAHMEEKFDDIAEGKIEWEPIISGFYGPFKENLIKKEKEVDKKELTEEKTDEVCEKCGEPMIIKTGRFGKFMACSGYPDCKNTKPVNGDGEPEEPEDTGEVCEKCSAPMVVKHGRFGKFLSCSKYPDCKSMKPIVKKTGVKCPKCNKGDIVERKTKRGKFFYGCDKYPDCDFALWQKPTGEECPECKSLLVFGAKKTARCSSKECTFKKDIEIEEKE